MDGSFNFPFKFNRSWLSDPGFNLWVSKIWPDLLTSSPENDLDLLSHKLCLLKKEVKAWTKAKSSSLESDSLKLDEQIGALLSGSSFSILSKED